MRTLIAHRQPGARSALRLFLEQEPGVSVVAEVDRPGEIVAKACSSRVDLVLLDYDLVATRIKELIVALHETRGLCVMVLCDHIESRGGVLHAGADYYVDKGESPDQLISALRKCLNKSNQEAQRMGEPEAG